MYSWLAVSGVAFWFPDRLQHWVQLRSRDHFGSRRFLLFGLDRGERFLEEHEARLPRGLGLGFGGERQVDCHLVTVEVGVECRADEWVQLDGLAFNQDRPERLDTQTVQRRCTVEQHGVLVDDFFQNVLGQS